MRSTGCRGGLSKIDLAGRVTHHSDEARIAVTRRKSDSRKRRMFAATASANAVLPEYWLQTISSKRWSGMREHSFRRASAETNPINLLFVALRCRN